MSAETRSTIVRGLVAGEIPAREARERLAQFPWDSETELQLLARGDVIRMLDRYIQGTVTADDVEQWAETIEGRDDIGFEQQARALLKEAIFEFANPDMTQQLEPKRAREWTERLSR